MEKTVKEYAWWTEGHTIDSEQVFTSEIATIKNAQEIYKESLPDDEYYFDYNYETDEICPIVNIGIVKRIDLDTMTKWLFSDIIQNTEDYIFNFGFGCDIETNFKTLKEDDEVLKKAIKNWLKKSYIMPSLVAIPLYKYDCKKCQIIKI